MTTELVTLRVAWLKRRRIVLQAELLATAHMSWQEEIIDAELADVEAELGELLGE